jgi:LIM-domain binding protein
MRHESGVVEELLFLGNVIESPLPAGGTSVICYETAEHLCFEGYSVIQYGHLKVVFNANLKIQLLDFSITGFDLHIDHTVVCTELRQLNQVIIKANLTG